jgi:hypothetical protein
MARGTILICLIAMGWTQAGCPLAAAEDNAAEDNAAKNTAASFDELTLLPRNTLAVARIASAEKLKADGRQLLKTFEKQIVDYAPPETLKEIQGQLKEAGEDLLDGSILDLGGIPNVGDPTQPRYFGLVVLPQPAKKVAVEAADIDIDADHREEPIAEFGVVRSADAEGVKKKLTEFDRQRYEREKKFFDITKSIRNTVGDSASFFNASGLSENLQEPEKPRPYHCIAHDGWVLYTNDKRCLSMLRRTLKDRKHSLATEIDPAARQALLAGDVSGAVNMTLILSQPDTQEAIAQMKREWEESVQLIDLLAIDWEQWDLDAATVKEYARKFIGASLVVMQEPRWLAGNVDVTDDAIVGAGVVTVKRRGYVDEFLTARPPVTLDLLDKLPADKPVYLAYRNDHSLQRLILSFYKRFAATVKEKREVRALARLLEAQPKQAAIAIDGPLRSDWGLRVLQIVEAKDPAAILQYAPHANKSAGKKRRVTYERGFEEFHGQKVDVKIEETDSDNAEGDVTDDPSALFGALAEAMKGTYRETWMLAREKHFLAAAGYAWDHAKQEFEGFRGGKNRTVRSKAFIAAAQHVDRRANILLMVNVPDVVLVGMKSLSQKLPLEFQVAISEPAARLAEVSKRGPQSYAAGSVTFLPGEIRGRFYFPIQQYAVLAALSADEESGIALVEPSVELEGSFVVPEGFAPSFAPAPSAGPLGGEEAVPYRVAPPVVDRYWNREISPPRSGRSLSGEAYSPYQYRPGGTFDDRYGSPRDYSPPSARPYRSYDSDYSSGYDYPSTRLAESPPPQRLRRIRPRSRATGFSLRRHR